MPSEVWMYPAEAGQILGEGHFLNTTVGVWLYESDLQDKMKLREATDGPRRSRYGARLPL